MPLFTTVDEVAVFLADIRRCHASAVLDKVLHTQENHARVAKLMDDLVVMLADRYKAGAPVPPLFLRDQYRHLAYYAILVLDTRFKPDKFAAMLLQKHDRYGDTGLLKWGHPGMVMRIGSKVDRFANLNLHPELDDAKDESRFDTLQDIVGYSVLGLMMMRRGV